MLYGPLVIGHGAHNANYDYCFLFHGLKGQQPTKAEEDIYVCGTNEDLVAVILRKRPCCHEFLAGNLQRAAYEWENGQYCHSVIG